MKAIKVKNIQKKFGGLEVLKGIDFEVQQGEVFTLLGANGAGKSTLINILTTLSKADAGEVSILGMPVGKKDDRIRESISLNAQTSTVDGEFTGYENLKMILELRGSTRIHEEISQIAQRLGLESFLKRKVMTYSGGMRRRLDLAMSLVGNPDIIFLDEPTTGIDPKNRLELWDMILQMRAMGKTIFLTTQYLDEADRLSDHIAFIHAGRIVRYGTPEEIKRTTVATYTIEVGEQHVKQVEDIFNAEKLEYQQTDNKFKLQQGTAQDGLSALLHQQIEVSHFNVDETDLETVFLKTTAMEE